MKGSINLLIIILAIGNVDLKTINMVEFYDYVEKSGIYKPIVQIANSLNRNVARLFCEEVIDNFPEFCDDLISNYIGEPYGPLGIIEEDESNTDSNVDSTKNVEEEKKTKKLLKKILFDKKFNSNWSKKMTDRKKNILIYKIMTKLRNKKVKKIKLSKM